MCLSPVLACASSFVAFWPVFLCADELLPVFSFAELLLETEPSSLGTLLRVTMETEAAISRQRVLRCSFSDRLAHPPALLVTWVKSTCVTKTPPPVVLKSSRNSRMPRRRPCSCLGILGAVIWPSDLNDWCGHSKTISSALTLNLKNKKIKHFFVFVF